MVDDSHQLRDEPDFDIVKPTGHEPEPEQPASSIGWWIVAAVLVVAAGFAGYWLVGTRSPAPPASTAATPVSAPPTEAPPRAAQALGGDAAPIDVPPLDQSDAAVRTLVKALSSNPRVAAWLTTSGLIRNFTVAVANIADGVTPAKHLTVVRPTSPFMITARGSDMRVDPRSYERYDGLAAAAESLDPAGVARLYSALKPRVAEAYRDLGQPDTPFDRTLERAIVQLLDTPVVDGSVRLKVRGGTGYAFVDPELESLTAAQKQLLRTGPVNQQRIQTSLRAIALALGIPASRLPHPRTVRAR
jgi:hypothetical protein